MPSSSIMISYAIWRFLLILSSMSGGRTTLGPVGVILVYRWSSVLHHRIILLILRMSVFLFFASALCWISLLMFSRLLSMMS